MNQQAKTTSLSADSGWNFDMRQAPRWRRLQLACRAPLGGGRMHEWTVFGEVGRELNSLDYAWREPRNAIDEQLAPLPSEPK